MTPARGLHRVFLLSPAYCGGVRARLLLSDRAVFPLAVRLREGGAPLGEVFAFLSGLYFRGKLAYARAFAAVPQGEAGALVITPGLGLVPEDRTIGLEELRALARIGVDPEEPRYRRPLARDTQALITRLGSVEVVLLGSIATGKYSDVLEEICGDRLLFPSAFVGRGDMSRGGLMLRSAREGRELTYVSLRGAVRHGPRPPRLAELRLG